MVGRAGTALSGIVTRVGEINNLISEIARNAQTQAVSLQQVNSAVADVDRVTQQNAAMVEQATAAARSLSREAGGLVEVVGQFDVGAHRPATGAKPRSFMLTTPVPKQAPAPRYASVGNAALNVSAIEDDWADF
jgi:methyl-accepting chemotaxis protein